jgi:hypothetical protein
MIAILEEQYFEWLYSRIVDPKITGRDKTYYNLIRQLHQKEFVYILPNDDNRWSDGKALRDEFLVDWEDYQIPSGWLELGCSMLEMLVALSDRLEFQTDEAAESWFWIMLKNLGISQFSDRRYHDEARKVIDEALDRVIWRKYSYSGEGGLFPLNRADRDQTKLEIWFQMHTYLLEHLW